MRTMRWEHADLVRVSGQSSSVVSQWLGKGSKDIKTIGKIEAALNIERASGYSALWVAKHIGPKMAPRPPPQTTLRVGEPAPSYFDADTTLEALRGLLGNVPAPMRVAVGDVLAAWAREGGRDDRKAALLALMRPSSKDRAAG